MDREVSAAQLMPL